MTREVVLAVCLVMLLASRQVSESIDLTSASIRGEPEVIETLNLAVASTQTSTQDLYHLIFTKGAQNFGDTRSFGIAVADVDMDEDVDVFLANFIGQSTLWINNGEGQFVRDDQTFGTRSTDAHGVTIDDLNGDRYPDIVLISQNDSNRIFLNDGTGAFTESEQVLNSNYEHPTSSILGDMDGDGDLDLVVTHHDAPNTLWVNDGNGKFGLSEMEFGDEGTQRMGLADFNGDQFPDVFLLYSDRPGELLINDGAGQFTDAGLMIGNPSNDYHYAIGDIDGDGDQDIVISNSVCGISIWMNVENTGVFQKIDCSSASGKWLLMLFDADLDGDLEILAASQEFGNSDNCLLLNEGAGCFTPQGQIIDDFLIAGMAAGDFDSDGDCDLVVGFIEGSGGNRIYWNEGERAYHRSGKIWASLP